MLLTSATFSGEGKFYYAFGEKISLIVKENTILVKYAENVSKTKAIEVIESISKTTKMKWHNSSIIEISTNSNEANEELMAKLRQKDEVQSCMPLYTLKNGMEMGVTDEILIRCLPDITEKQRQELEGKFNLKVTKETKLYQKLKVPKGRDALDIANQCYKSGLVEFATPNFVSYPKFHQVFPNDTYFNMQITCYNTGQTINDGHSGSNDADIDAPEAWALTTGSNNIVIAVLDQGVTSDHPDLPNSRQVRLDGSNFGDGNVNDPSPTGNDNHGNACAGVIAATHNNIGIRGIAPNVNIIPINIFNDWVIQTRWINGQPFNVLLQSETANDIASAIDEAWDTFGADVLSNSWVYRTTNADDIPDSDEIILAINRAQTQGRGGLGSIVIFSSGNSNNNFSGVPFPANVEDVLTVGAVNSNGTVWNYSSRGNELDVVAPSGNTDLNGDIVTTDRMGANGYDPGNYTTTFGGTSAACPQVAGIAALILSVRPDLTQAQVRHAIESTCTKLSGYSFSNNSAHPNGTWNNNVGHGLVNAYAAVYSVAPRISGPTLICTGTPQTFSVAANVPPSYTWDTSAGLSLTTNSNGTATVRAMASNGDGWVSIKNGNVEMARYNVTVNFPQINQVQLPKYVPTNSLEIVLPPKTYPDVTGYVYSWEYYGQPPNAYLSMDGAYDAVVIFYTPSESYMLTSKAKTACGTSPAATFRYIFNTYGWSPVQKVYPNSASNILNIEFDQSVLAQAKTLEQTTTDGKQLKQDPTFDIRLYDNQGTLLRRSTTKDGSVQFNVANLPNGMYYLHIYDGKSEKPEMRQIVVEH